MAPPVEDIEAIRRLISVYSYAVDRRDYAEVGEILADAAFSLSWESEGIETGEIRGREAIAAWYEEHLEGRRPSRHVITNTVIDVDDEGRTASAYAYLTSVGHPPEGGPAVILSGHYEHRFERRDGEWRFTQMRCVMELP